MASRRARFQERMDVWPGFTDIMVGVFLVFAFVVTLFVITETILSQSLNKKDKELVRLHTEISQKIDELKQLRIALARLEELFNAEVEKSGGLAQTLSRRTEELQEADAKLEQQRKAVSERDQMLALLRIQLDSALSDMQAKAEKVKQLETSVEEQRQSLASALSEAKEKSNLLGEREQRISELGQKLAQGEESLTRIRSELSEKTGFIEDFKATIAALSQRISLLNKQIAGYLEEVNRLNRLLVEAKERETEGKTKTASLQKEITSLTSQLDTISKKLADAQEAKAKEFRLTQLVSLIGRKDKEIERLRKLAKYRSEFLAKLGRVFAGVPDIKVQGDRFIFQSEILFASGRADINESGKKELDKFVSIYKEMSPKLPGDLPLLILVQGHTDTDPVRSSRYKSNWELSSARALEVVRYMIQKGVPPSRVGVAALSEFHPVARGTSLEAKRLNRRIEIKITTL